MFERFTDDARRVVVLAQEEARLLGHDYIGTEHLMLGLWHVGNPGVEVVARQLDLSLETMRREVEETVGRGESSPSSHIPFTPGAKKSLEMSLRQALRYGHRFIAAEHILLGVLSQEDELGAQLVLQRDITSDAVADLVTPMIGDPSGAIFTSPAGSMLAATIGCPHPNSSLVWEPVDVPGLDEDTRPMVVVRCDGCGRALSIVDRTASA